MRNLPRKKLVLGLLLALAAGMAQAQWISSWVAYNDYNTGATTSSNATLYANGTIVAATNSGPLKHIGNGTNVAVTLTVTNFDATVAASGGHLQPATGTPAYTNFYGYVDFSGNGIGLPVTPADNRLVHVFTGLDPAKKYSFRGSAVRGGAAYTYRWTLCRLDGALSFRNAHSSNVLTSASTDIPVGTLATNQVAFNCGVNNTASSGDIVDWEDIVPPASGTIAIYSFRYTNSIPSRYGVPGNYATNNTHSYALAGIRLEEFFDPRVAIASQPQNVETCSGQLVTFTVGVTGLQPIRFQWRKNGTNIVGATNQTLTIDSVVPADASTNYTVVCTNSVNSVTSAPASLILPTGLSIASQPQNTTPVYGATATFTASVSSNAYQPIYYQWYGNLFPDNLTGTLMAGATGSQLTITNVTATNAAYFYVVANNCAGYATSQVASLIATYLPVNITNQPQNVVAAPGSSATFTVRASGSLLSYQWYKDGTAIPNATNATFAVSNVLDSDRGYYHVLVSNPIGYQPSTRAALIVPIASYEAILLTNKVWKYNQGGVSLGTAWKEVSYDDSSWPTGRSAFAYETGNALVEALTNTVLLLTNPPPANRIITYYFRTTFNVTNDLSRISLTFSNLIDDGCVVYLNGVEAYRIRIDAGVAVTYNTLAANATEGVFDVTNLSSALLVPGTNTLAVEVHQTSATSSDVTFGLSLTVNPLVPATPPQITSQPQDVAVVEEKPATFTVGYLGEGVVFQWHKLTPAGDQIIPGATRPSFTITNPVLGKDDLNTYYVTLSNVLSGVYGAVASRQARLAISLDTNGPVLTYADGSVAVNTITLSFDERLLPFDTNNPAGSPTNASNYTVTNTFGESLTVLSAQFVSGSTNDTNIVLTTDGSRRADANYIVTFKSLRDASPQRNLSTNLAAPVSTLLPLINWHDPWTFTQPWPEDDKTDFNNHNWSLPGFFADHDNPPFWADGQAVFYAYYTSVEMADWPAQGIQSINASGDYGSNAYFRLNFSYIASPMGASTTWMRYLTDDGAVFYLNGTEFQRYNMPAGNVTFNSSATAAITDPQTQGPTNVPMASLLLGTNLMAVELHRYLPGTDYDMAFGMEMQMHIDSLVTGKVVITTSPASVTVAQGKSADFNFRAVGGLTCQWLTNAVPVPGATNFVFGMNNIPFSANGTLVTVAITGRTNTAISKPALLTVLSDTNPPTLVSAYTTATNTITVTFSEAVTASTATNVLNYAITNIFGGSLTITNVTLVNGTNALVQVSALPNGIYIVVVNNVTDTAGVPNPILPNSRVTLGVQNYPLVALDATTLWRYNTNNIDLSNAWRTVTYDDSAWPLGAALFDGKKTGRTAGDLATNMPDTVRTVLPLTSVGSANDIPTYYFRTKFYVPPLFSQGATLSLRHVLDDGAAFYLNNQFLYSLRVVLPTTFAAYGGTTSPNSAAGDYPIYEGPFGVSSSYLLGGTNLLAVEVKNNSATSSDITFGTWLYLNVPSSYVLPVPEILSGPTVAPTNVVPTGGSFSISVTATSVTATAYQWRKWGTNIIGATNATLSYSNVTTAHLGTYEVVVSNPFGDTRSAAVSVTVQPPPPPVIVTGPTVTPGSLIQPGNPFSISVIAIGAPSLQYQWFKNGTYVPSGTNATFSIASATSGDVGIYEVLVSNPYGYTPSTMAQVTMNASGPAITSAPTVTPTNSIFATQSFTNTVVASGTEPLSYLWRKGGVSLGRTTPTTYFLNATTNDSGAYDVVVTNALGAVTSVVVNVTVKPLPRLFVAATNANRVVVWWTNLEPLVLLATNKVGIASGAWTYVTNGHPYIVPATNAAQFYRLKY